MPVTDSNQVSALDQASVLDMLKDWPRHPDDNNIVVGAVDPYLAARFVAQGYLKAAFVEVDTPLTRLSNEEAFDLLSRIHEVSGVLIGDFFQTDLGHKNKQNMYANGQHILDFFRDKQGISLIKRNDKLTGQDIAENISVIKEALHTEIHLTSNILLEAFQRRAGWPNSRVRTTPPNTGHEGFVKRPHSHGLTVQFSICGGETECIVGDVDYEVCNSTSDSTKAIILPEVPSGVSICKSPARMLSIVGASCWHNTDGNIGEKGQFIIEALYFNHQPQLVDRWGRSFV